MALSHKKGQPGLHSQGGMQRTEGAVRLLSSQITQCVTGGWWDVKCKAVHLRHNKKLICGAVCGALVAPRFIANQVICVANYAQSFAVHRKRTGLEVSQLHCSLGLLQCSS